MTHTLEELLALKPRPSYIVCTDPGKTKWFTGGVFYYYGVQELYRDRYSGEVVRPTKTARFKIAPDTHLEKTKDNLGGCCGLKLLRRKPGFQLDQSAPRYGYLTLAEEEVPGYQHVAENLWAGGEIKPLSWQHKQWLKIPPWNANYCKLGWHYAPTLGGLTYLNRIYSYKDAKELPDKAFLILNPTQCKSGLGFLAVEAGFKPVFRWINANYNHSLIFFLRINNV